MSYQGPYTKDRTRYLILYTWRRADSVSSGLPINFRQRCKLTKTRTGYSNRSYRQQISKLQNATTPMNGVNTTVDLIRGMTRLNWRNPRNVHSPNIEHETIDGDLAANLLTWDNLTPSDSANNRAYERATADAYQKIRQAQVQVSGPTFLGEARETLRMLRSPAKGLRDLSKSWLDTLAKRKKANPKGWVKDISSAWLEHSFGWTPLLHDIEDGMKAWNRLHDLERVMPFSGYGIETTDRGVTYTSNSGLLTYTIIRHVRQDISTRIVKYRGFVKATAKMGPRAQLELFGFTPSEFLPTAWELLPWSFLIDYFANIGDIISAGVTDTSGIAWVNRTDIAIYDIKVNSALDVDKIKTILSNDDVVFTDCRPSLVRWQRRTVARGPNFPLTPPSLTFSLPGSKGQLANMAALLGQAKALHPQRAH